MLRLDPHASLCSAVTKPTEAAYFSTARIRRREDNRKIDYKVTLGQDLVFRGLYDKR